MNSDSMTTTAQDAPTTAQRTLKFGKHKGKTLDEALYDVPYWDWYLGKRKEADMFGKFESYVESRLLAQKKKATISQVNYDARPRPSLSKLVSKVDYDARPRPSNNQPVSAGEFTPSEEEQ